VSDVLLSGQDQLPGLVEGRSGYTVAALVVLLLCKGLACVPAPRASVPRVETSPAPGGGRADRTG
jgi:hypothetical protein